MKHNHALNVKRKLLQMLLACAELALQLVVKSAEKIIAFKISLTKISARLVTQEFLKREPDLSQSEGMSPNLLHATMTSLNSRRASMNKRSKQIKDKTPEDPIYICKSCANRKHMNKAERVWIREGVCDFCFERAYICQAIEYTAADATNLH